MTRNRIMDKHKAIKTSIGILKGRDCIYFDKLNLNKKSTLEIEGEINRSLVNSDLVSPKLTSLKFLPYKLEFIGVLSFKVTELETWLSQSPDDALDNASFLEVLDSEWITSLCDNRVNSNRHYLLQTYDGVIEVVCRQFKLSV